MTYQSILSQLGFSKNAVQVYVAALKFGICTIKDIAKETGLVRQLVYEAIYELVHKGLITKEPIGKNRFHYVPSSPDSILDLIKKQEEDIKHTLPELQEMYKASKSLPKIRIYENKIACRQMLREFLKLFGRNEEILVISSTDIWYNLDPAFTEDFWLEKSKTGVATKLLSVDDDSARYLAHQENYEVRKLPQGFTFKGDLMIYGDLVSIMSVDKFDIHAITIDSKQIAEMHRNIFFGIWKKAKIIID